MLSQKFEQANGKTERQLAQLADVSHGNLIAACDEVAAWSLSDSDRDVGQAQDGTAGRAYSDGVKYVSSIMAQRRSTAGAAAGAVTWAAARIAYHRRRKQGHEYNAKKR